MITVRTADVQRDRTFPVAIVILNEWGAGAAGNRQNWRQKSASTPGRTRPQPDKRRISAD